MTANPFADATAWTLLEWAAATHAAREAIIFGDERVTFGALRQRALALAAGLAALGLTPGDKLAIWLPNRPAWFVAQYACARLGVVVVALNPRYRAHELTYILAQSEATALLVTDYLGRAASPSSSRRRPRRMTSGVCCIPPARRRFRRVR